jgi:hypothetical protein
MMSISLVSKFASGVDAANYSTVAEYIADDSDLPILVE